MAAADAPAPPPIAELGFVFQPIEPLGGHDAWVEALVRWHLPDGTVRGPLEVLPHWLAPGRRATFTRLTFAWAAEALAVAPRASVSVNLSPDQVLDPHTQQVLEAMLPALRRRLRIEVTEQRARDLRSLGSALADLRARCGGLLLDDVTAGDLDLRSRLCDALDGVKLDRSVVEGVFDPSTAAAMRRFTRAACERFAIVVAEGIEDADRCDALHDLGVTHVQGFAIGRPRGDLGGTVVEHRVRSLAPEPAIAASPFDTVPPRPARCDGRCD